MSSVRIRSTPHLIGRSRSNSPDTWAKRARNQPMLTGVGRIWADVASKAHCDERGVGRTGVGLQSGSPNFVRIRTSLAQSGTNVAQVGPKSVQELVERRPRSPQNAHAWAIRAKFGRSRAKASTHAADQAETCQQLADIGTKSDGTRAHLVEFGPIWAQEADVGRTNTRSTRLRTRDGRKSKKAVSRVKADYMTTTG